MWPEEGAVGGASGRGRREGRAVPADPAALVPRPAPALRDPTPALPPPTPALPPGPSRPPCIASPTGVLEPRMSRLASTKGMGNDRRFAFTTKPALFLESPLSSPFARPGMS